MRALSNRTTTAILLALIIGLTLPWAAAAAGEPLRFAAPRGTRGAVASGEAQATEAGLGILGAGGNAVDAAVATALALAVTFPEAGNLGGGGFAVVRFGDEIASLDFREVAPAAAHESMYLDAAGEPLEDASLVGPLASGAPGSPHGLHALHTRFGKLAWADVVAPAERLAAEGFRISTRTHASLVEKSHVLTRFDATKAVWFDGDEPLAAGETLRLPRLAETLAAYAERGPELFRRGAVAESIVAAAERHGGVLSLADLAGYEPTWREPIRFEAFGHRFAAMDLPSSGGVIVGQTLQVLERLGWRDLEPGSTERDHLLIEAWRHVFADRFLLGDPSTSEATGDELVAKAWIDRRVGEIDRARAGSSEAIRPAPATAAVGNDDTTHLSVVDGDGNIVALTTTVNGLFGCSLWVPGFGFLNNQMDDFNTAPGRPNLYGLVQGDANLVRPGKRMLSSMSPTIAWSDDRAIALGGRGGSRIPTATTQVLLHWFDGVPLQTALDRPRIHHQWLPNVVRFEEGARTPAQQTALEALGHQFEPSSGIGKVHAIAGLPDGQVEAAADPRGPGSAGVVRPRQ